MTLNRPPILLAIALSLLLVLSGCASPSAESGRLVIWHTWSEAEAVIIEQLIADFEQLYPDIHVSLERKDTNSGKDINNLLEDYVSASQDGLGPDIIIGLDSVFSHFLYQNDLILDLNDEAIHWSSFAPETLQAVQRGGDVRVGVPVNAYVSVLFYNRATVERPAQTFDELLAASAEGKLVGLPAKFFASYWGVTGLGGSVFDGNALAENSPEALADWMEWLLTFRETPGAVLSPDLPALAESFAKGDLDLLVATSLELAALQEALGEENVGVAVLPGMPTTRPFSNIELMVVNSASVQVDSAALLLNFMTNESQQRKMSRSVSGRAPVNTSVILSEALFPEVSLITQQYQSAIVPTTEQDGIINFLIPATDPMFQQVLEGVITPEDAGQEIVKTVTEQLEER